MVNLPTKMVVEPKILNITDHSSLFHTFKTPIKSLNQFNFNISNFRMNRCFCIILLALANIVSGTAQTSKRPKVAVVLSGGGAKGFAHIGALKVLEQAGIPIDIIVGTSMGSIVGGFYSLGYSASEIDSIVRREDWGKLLTDDVGRNHQSQFAKEQKQRYVASLLMNDKFEPKVPQGVVNGQNIINLFGRLASNIPSDADFSKFPIDFACVGTNLQSGKEMILNHGFLPTAIYSSMSIPGVFLPVEHDGNYMLDGGLVDNFPTDIAKKMGADIIIGVDIRNDLHDINDIVSIKQLMDQLINFYTLSKDSLNKSLCNIIIRPDITGYNVYSFNANAVDTLIRRGIDAANSKLDEILALKKKYNLPDPVYDRSLKMLDSIEVDNITLSGKYSINDKFILDFFDIDAPGKYTPAEIQDAIDKLYGLGFFKRIFFKIYNTANQHELNLVLDELPLKNFNVGLRVNNRDAVSMLLNYTQKDFRRFIGLLSFTAEISSNPGFEVYSELSKGKWPVIGFELNGKEDHYGIYTDKIKAYSTDLYYASANLYTYKSLKKASIVGLGVKEEYFNGDIFNAEHIDSSLATSKKKLSVTSLYTYYSLDNLDDYYFPEKGSEVYSEFSLSSNPDYSTICPAVMVRNRNIYRLTQNSSLLLNFYGRAILLNSIHPFKYTYVGGTEYSTYYNYHFPFYGLPAVTPVDQYALIGAAGIRLKFAHKHYVTLFANCMLGNKELYPFKNYSTTIGTALKYSAKSAFGPIDVTAGFSGGYNKPLLSVNFGYWF
jgi:NTE family protein